MKNSFRRITRRQLLTRAGAALGTGLLLPGQQAFGVSTWSHPSEDSQESMAVTDTVVFTHTTIVTGDANRAPLKDMALAVKGNTIAGIGPTDSILKEFPDAEVIDGRHKALLPGLINCHAHLSAAVARGFNEDFGFPTRADLAVSPSSALSSFKIRVD